MKFVLVLVGAVLGGLFINDKMSVPQHTENKTEIVMGHRIGPDGGMMLVTK